MFNLFVNVEKSAELTNPRLAADDVGIFTVTVAPAVAIFKSDPVLPELIVTAPVKPFNPVTTPANEPMDCTAVPSQ